MPVVKNALKRQYTRQILQENLELSQNISDKNKSQNIQKQILDKMVQYTNYGIKNPVPKEFERIKQLKRQYRQANRSALVLLYMNKSSIKQIQSVNQSLYQRKQQDILSKQPKSEFRPKKPKKLRVCRSLSPKQKRILRRKSPKKKLNQAKKNLKILNFFNKTNKMKSNLMKISSNMQ